MQVVTPELVHGKKVLLRLDIDVPIKDGKVVDDFRLKAGLPTLKMCLENAQEVIIMGHIGRPKGFDPELSVEPIYDWLESQGLSSHIECGKLKLLENLRFEVEEDNCDLAYARQLASLGDVFVNEAFASYHESASTTVLPTLLPHFAGLRFAEEVEKLTEVRDNPKHPLVAIIGGAKVEDKLPVVEAMSKIADYVLVGGKLAGQSSDNILIAELNEVGTDVTAETIEKWKPIIREAKMIVWNGPLGKIEEPKNFQTHELANIIIQSEAESVVGGGDTIGYLGKLGLLERFSFVSTGGGAMLKFLIEGTLPTIEALK
ncbi:MAG: phosphoglycerate kinase [Candidatus Daviesbacteria bacterium]|nr:phosphoglycerate kinase [Candidatus Daviesbacteria bacterium]